MFVVRRLQEIGRKAGLSLFVCFIDPQKAYDIVDRTLLWQVLTRIRVPPQMIAVIQQFQDGMRASRRPDDGVCPDWFEREQGLGQANMRAIPAVVQHLLRSRADRCPPKIQRRYGHILVDLVHLKESPTDVDGTGAGYGLRSPCGVGHTLADDACIVSRSPHGLAKMMEVTVEVC